MNKPIGITAVMLCILFSLSACGDIGDKSTDMSIIYGVTAVLSLLLLIAYCYLIHKKDVWFLLLFSSVTVANTGYFTLSVSKNIEEALLANRISYLGSVLLPFAMMMIILNVLNLKYKRWLPGFLLAISLVIFFIAASPGYLDIYYKEVSFEIANGVSILNKEYGSWHSVYLFYLIIYFSAMVLTIAYSAAKNKIVLKIHSIILAVAVFVNVCVWLLEQLVKINFEFLSVSYVISELFLLSLYLMIQENGSVFSFTEKSNESQTIENMSSLNRSVEDKTQTSVSTVTVTETTVAESDSNVTKKYNSDKTEEAVEQEDELSPDLAAICETFETNLSSLTPSERSIYNFYLEGKTTKEIMSELNIKENTLKYHNKNLYGKLGVSSRKQLLKIAAALERKHTTIS